MDMYMFFIWLNIHLPVIFHHHYHIYISLKFATSLVNRALSSRWDKIRADVTHFVQTFNHVHMTWTFLCCHLCCIVLKVRGFIYYSFFKKNKYYFSILGLSVEHILEV
ncbi:hypothetical protein ACJX0J_031643, partial [Zea mays]